MAWEAYSIGSYRFPHLAASGHRDCLRQVAGVRRVRALCAARRAIGEVFTWCQATVERGSTFSQGREKNRARAFRDLADGRACATMTRSVCVCVCELVAELCMSGRVSCCYSRVVRPISPCMLSLDRGRALNQLVAPVPVRCSFCYS